MCQMIIKSLFWGNRGSGAILCCLTFLALDNANFPLGMSSFVHWNCTFPSLTFFSYYSFWLSYFSTVKKNTFISVMISSDWPNKIPSGGQARDRSSELNSDLTHGGHKLKYLIYHLLLPRMCLEGHNPKHSRDVTVLHSVFTTVLYRCLSKSYLL